MRFLLHALLRPPEECPWPRPPGALPEEEFLAACTRCDRCIDACPHGAIGRLPGTSRWSGTPAMDPNAAPCHLCPDRPCIAACDDGALAPVPDEALFFGLAVVEKDRCFAFRGPECGACVPACPVGAVSLAGTRPVIDGDRCVGCGLCRAACPVWDKAITVVH